MEFSENLKQLLKDRNMKQADLCRLTKIRSSLMSNYTTGKKSPTIFNAVLIADAFDISLDALVGRKERVRYPDPFENGYAGQPDGYGTQLNAYGTQLNAYANQPGGYINQLAGYANQPGGYANQLNECMDGLTENESTFVLDMIQVMKKNFGVKEKQ